MVSALFAVCMILIFGKWFLFGIKAAWGISKFLLTVVLLPIALVVMVIGGLITFAFPILILIGIVGLFATRR